MKEFITANTGKKVCITCASMAEVKRLKQIIVKELKNNPIGLKLLNGGETILDRSIDFTGVMDFIKNVLLGIDCSDEFEEAIFSCLKYCTYDTVHKITKDLFENDKCPQAREDYYEIIIACTEENLRPFVKSLVSAWKIRAGNFEFIQKLTSK